MSSEKVYKCSFKHCNISPCEVKQGEAIKVGNRYMHQQCAEIYKNINDIKNLYYEKISNTVVMSQLVNVINNIIFIKKIDSEYLLFALTFAIDNKFTINSPYGLHYIIDNSKIKNMWNTTLANRKRKELDVIIQENETNNIGTTFNYTNKQHTGFEEIFKGGY